MEVPPAQGVSLYVAGQIRPQTPQPEPRGSKPTTGPSPSPALASRTPTRLTPMPDPPSFFFITTDQQRWDTLRCAGNPAIRTPHVDALAARPSHSLGFVAQPGPTTESG